jgi:hypothetical protein
MAVYSHTIFLNEFDLLDLKLAEELDQVDKFVIAESSQTFQGEEKPLHLEGNPRYQHPKIDLVFHRDRFETGDDTWMWTNESFQRDSLLPTSFEDDDVFIVTDVDEIINGDDIPMIVEQARTHGLVRLRQLAYHYKINLLIVATIDLRSQQAFAATGEYVRRSGIGFSKIRRRHQLGVPIDTRGKHFTYLGDPEQVSYKLRSFSHAEFNKPEFTDVGEIQRRMDQLIDPLDRDLPLRPVEIDASYPRTIRDNLEAWKKHIYGPV